MIDLDDIKDRRQHLRDTCSACARELDVERRARRPNASRIADARAALARANGELARFELARRGEVDDAPAMTMKGAGSGVLFAGRTGVR